MMFVACLPGTFPLLCTRARVPFCSISQCDDVSRDDIITFRAFPWAGALVASPHEDWNRMFCAQEGWVEWPRFEGHKGGSLLPLAE